MSASNYLELELLDHVLGNAAYSAPGTLYISLHTADPGETGASEVSGNSYARASVTNNATNFPAASAGSKSNGTVINFATPTSTGWSVVSHFGIWDASTSGNFLIGGALNASKTINGGDAVSIGIGGLTVTMD